MKLITNICLNTVDISYKAPNYQGSSHEHQILSKSCDADLQAGPMAKREDFKKTTKMLYSLREEQGKVDSFIPKDKRTRQRDELDLALQKRLEWLSRHWREAFSNQHFNIVDVDVDTQLVE